MPEIPEDLNLLPGDATSFKYLFGQLDKARKDIRLYAEPFVRAALGDYVADGSGGWSSWSVEPVYDSDVMTYLKVVITHHDDRGPGYTDSVLIPVRWML